MKKFISEFKEFALKGNVLDLAIAVIMGGAVGKVVTSLVDSILMPIVGILLGGKDFSKLGITVGNAVIKYGDFIQSVIDFLIISLFIFLMMKGINKLTAHIPKLEDEKEEEPKEIVPTTEELLLEIRDLLKEEQKK